MLIKYRRLVERGGNGLETNEQKTNGIVMTRNNATSLAIRQCARLLIYNKHEFMIYE